MKQSEVINAARLEGVYAVLRKLQATHNGFKTACTGTGRCCDVGLRVSLLECWNIARNLRRQYWLLAEDESIEQADRWYKGVINKLKDAFDEPNWKWNNEDAVLNKCAFFGDGCTIYEFRPMVCRAYGVIAPVEDGVCGRPRLEAGGHELIWDDTAERTIAEFDAIVKEFGEENPDLNFSIYLPAGVLRFLLPVSELQDLIASTDEKYWVGTPGYQHQINPKFWESEVQINGAK